MGKDSFRTRVAKSQFTRKAQRAVCSCHAQNGDPKTLYSQKWMASRSAGMLMEPGRLWQVYKCPGGGGWHIASVRWNPWASDTVDA